MYGFDEFDGGVFDGEGLGIQGEVWAHGGLEGAGFSGEVFDLAAGGFGVEAFDVALFTGFVGGFYVNFKKVFLSENASGEIAELALWGDGGDENDGAVVDKNFGHFRDAADVLKTVFIGEAEIAIQAGAEVIAIEDEGEAALLVEDALGGVGDGGFTRAGESAHPDGEAFLFEEGFLVVAVEEAVGFGKNIHF